MKATSPYLNIIPRTRYEVIAGKKMRYLTETEIDAFMDEHGIPNKPVPTSAPLWFRILMFLGILAIIGFVGGVFLPSAAPARLCRTNPATIPSCVIGGHACVIPIETCK
jgi:hypothetical protein